MKRRDGGFERYEYSILDWCEDIHCARTGSGDHIEPYELRKMIRALQLRERKWERRGFCERYDDAVRELMRAALAEACMMLMDEEDG